MANAVNGSWTHGSGPRPFNLVRPAKETAWELPDPAKGYTQVAVDMKILDHSRWSSYASIYFTDSDADGRQDSSEVCRVSAKVDAVRPGSKIVVQSLGVVPFFDLQSTAALIVGRTPDVSVADHGFYRNVNFLRSAEAVTNAYCVSNSGKENTGVGAAIKMPQCLPLRCGADEGKLAYRYLHHIHETDGNHIAAYLAIVDHDGAGTLRHGMLG